MNIGLLREGKPPPDKRVAFSPDQCAYIMQSYPELSLYAQPSQSRCFLDLEYEKNGVIITEDLSNCDVIMGIKEVPIDMLINNKIFFFFSHTIKKQPYNKLLLQAILEKNIQLVDYETLRGGDKKRIIGFGRYAGIVGCYNSFLAYGKKSTKYNLKAPQLLMGIKELYKELKKVSLPKDFKIVLTGNGRVANGAIEILEALGVKKVNKFDFLNQIFSSPTYVQLNYLDYNERIDNELVSKQNFYNNPTEYKSVLSKYTQYAHMLITGHYYAAGNPILLSKAEIQKHACNMDVIADISCDIDGPIGSTIRPSTIENPIYGYNPGTQLEDDYNKDGVIAIMAVDNLPCALPRDASLHFGEVFIQKVLPDLLTGGNIISQSTITLNGQLTDNFNYLRDYVL